MKTSIFLIAMLFSFPVFSLERCFGPFIEIPQGWHFDPGDSVDSSYGSYRHPESGASIDYDIGFAFVSGDWAKAGRLLYSVQIGSVFFGIDDQGCYVATAHEFYEGTEINWNFKACPHSETQLQSIRELLGNAIINYRRNKMC